MSDSNSEIVISYGAKAMAVIYMYDTTVNKL